MATIDDKLVQPEAQNRELTEEELAQASGGEWAIDGTTEGGLSSRLHHDSGTDADRQGHTFEGSAGLIRKQKGSYW